MPLDDLVSVIWTLQRRICAHGAALRENETRTRMALCDPLLRVLGWDVSDPGLVMPEYNVFWPSSRLRPLGTRRPAGRHHRGEETRFVLRIPPDADAQLLERFGR